MSSFKLSAFWNGPACPVCQSRRTEPSVEKFGVRYYSCAECAALFSGDIDSRVLITHNEAAGERAEPAIQQARLARVVEMLGRRPEKILDFGCGQGRYVSFLQQAGYDAVGIDQDTELKLSDMKAESVDAVNMVEVIEHLGNSVEILGRLRDILKPRGVIYIESSFVDFIGDPAASGYVDPRIGHCCIHSRQSMDYMGRTLGMSLLWLNNNVVVMHKSGVRPAAAGVPGS